MMVGRWGGGRGCSGWDFVNIGKLGYYDGIFLAIIVCVLGTVHRGFLGFICDGTYLGDVDECLGVNWKWTQDWE